MDRGQRGKTFISFYFANWLPCQLTACKSIQLILSSFANTQMLFHDLRCQPDAAWASWWLVFWTRCLLPAALIPDTSATTGGARRLVVTNDKQRAIQNDYLAAIIMLTITISSTGQMFSRAPAYKKRPSE